MCKVVVGMSTCGVSAGARNAYDKISGLLSESDVKVDTQLSITGCIGMCYREPLVEVRDGEKRTIYGDVTEKLAAQIVEEHVLAGKPLQDHVVLEFDGEEVVGGSEADYIRTQERIVLRNCGLINPEIIEEYEQRGGYQALSTVLNEMSTEEVIAEIKESGLKGRGGGGFLTGLKWGFAAKNESDHKYVICNADEGDPGAFMDRSVLEGDPHAVIEGMLICGRAIGADFGYIYCRAEYPRAIARLRIALDQARDKGFLGENIQDSGFSFEIKIKEGAGAFVCGEETALMASIEGKRGMPNIRPPFPAEKGLWGKPSNINNVETLANVPWIIRNGASSYNCIGTETSKGTKVFALAGTINKGGLIEVPMGLTINEIVYNIAGGIKGGGEFKAVQMGGPSGGCIPASLGETIVDYENVTKTGAIMGSGGLVVVDESTCMVEMARFFLEFTQRESCGKCTFCRIGTLRMSEILERITRGDGVPEDIDKLMLLAAQIKEASLCGLGQTAPNPVLTTLDYFKDEYEAHIHDKTCPGKYCLALVDYFINAELCTKCGLCAKACSVEAITGDKHTVYKINQDKCVKCGKCVSSCSFDAVYKG